MNANLWLSKCPGRNDMYDTGGWEMIAWELTKRFGLNVTETTIGKFSGNGHKFLTKRFDWIPGGKKIHYASAMKLLEYLDRTNYKDGASNHEFAAFLMRHESDVNHCLEGIWHIIGFKYATKHRRPSRKSLFASDRQGLGTCTGF